jgi:hypothetical protein
VNLLKSIKIYKEKKERRKAHIPVLFYRTVVSEYIIIDYNLLLVLRKKRKEKRIMPERLLG